MNFKKTIAGICALAMVGTCGVSVFAEDVTTTTTNVKDGTTVTTVGTEEMTDASAAMTEGTKTEESVTTGVTTEATEETTTETAVTEEDVSVKADADICDNASYKIDDTIITVYLSRREDDTAVGGIGLYLTISDGVNSLEFYVNTGMQISQGSVNFEGQNDIDTYLSVSGNTLRIKKYNLGLSYDVVEYFYSKESGFSMTQLITTTTTATDIIETTTTTTATTVNVEPIVTEEQLRKIFADFLAENGYEGNIISFYVGESGDLEASAQYTKDGKSVSCTVTKDGVTNTEINPINVLDCKSFELNGIKFFAQLIGGTMNDGSGHGTRELTIYCLASDGTYIATNLSNIILIDNLTGGSNQGDYSVIDNWIRVDGDKLSLCVSRNEGENNVFEVKTTYTWDKASNKFVTGILEKTFYVSIPYNYITIDGVSFPTANKSISDLTVTECTNGNIASIDRGCEVGDGICFVRGISVENVKPGELIINGKCSGYNTLDESHKLAGYTPFYDEGITHNFTIKVMVNEDGTISPYTEPKPNPDNNTDSKPSKKNPAGTGSSPKTGENAVLPVALALTFVAGTAVVAGIKKKKK